MIPGAASFARRWPAGLTRLPVDAALGPALLTALEPGTIVELGRDVGLARWFEIADAALARGAWIALPASELPELARAFGVAGPLGPALVLAPRRASRPAARRLLDLAIGGALTVLLSPVLALVALGVWLSSTGPVLFRVRVVGLGGRSFEWYKFRTMRPPRPDDERQRREAFAAFARGERCDEPDFKVVDDSRVTRLGGFLRRHSLDELPQLWNVLRGDMALVGPRPCLEYETEHYRDWQRRRFEVVPGLTGLWQVYGRSRVEFEEAVVMDILYGYVRSTGFDLALIARTIGVVVRGHGGR